MNEVTAIANALLCGVEDWMEIWGDPLLSGSIFMLSYGIAAWLVFRASRETDDQRERYYWRLCGAIFAFQLANTPLDLHALVWTSGRCLAHAQDWYDNRREIQLWFLLGLAILVAFILLIVLITFFRNIFRNILLTLGVVVSLGFTVVKGINYHGLEEIYGGLLGPFRIADYIEYSGIILAITAALIRLRSSTGHH